MAHKEKRFKARLLKLLTKKNNKPLDLGKVKKVLVLKYDRIGDMLATTPIFRELKLAYPDIDISVIASNANQSVIRYNPYIKDIFINNKDNLISDLRTLFFLRKKRFDVCIELEHSVVYHAILRLRIINPKVVFSIHKDGRYGTRGSELELYKFHTLKNKKDNFGKIWLQTLTFFGINPVSEKYDLFLSKYEREKAQEFLSHFDKELKIGVNLEGSFQEKQIQLKELRQICKGIHKGYQNIKIIILASPNQKQKIDHLLVELGLDFVIPSYFSILDVSALIQQLDLIITPDTSIVHIASAFNKPIVTIHENNLDSYRLWGPTSTMNKTIFAKSEHGLFDYSVDDIVSSSLEMISKIND